MSDPRVLVVADYYLPGFRAGGPVRAISNTLRRLAPRTDFYVITRDHDVDGIKYGDVEVGRWTEGPAGRIRYAPRLTPALLQRCVADTSCDVIWLNSFFSRASLGVLAYRRLGRIRVPVLLAPRGELSPSALALKRRRKALAIRLLRWTGCLRSVHWLASSDTERHDMIRTIGAHPITFVPESVAEPPVEERWPAKSPGRLRAVFASRIAPTKNLLFLLEVLERCHGDIQLDIIGPLEDAHYWARCRALMQRLAGRVVVEYAGELSHDALQRRLSTYDLMILPTRGENFGHVIVEAWAAGCPVLVSDRTPWRQLRSEDLGWDVPLDHGAWAAAIGECLEMGAEVHLAMRRSARTRARHVSQEGAVGDASLRRLLEEVSRRPASVPEGDLVSVVDSDPCA